MPCHSAIPVCPEAQALLYCTCFSNLQSLCSYIRMLSKNYRSSDNFSHRNDHGHHMPAEETRTVSGRHRAHHPEV